MKKLAVAAALAAALLAVILIPFLLALVGVLFGASAAAASNPCLSPIAGAPAASGPVRLPVIGNYTATSEYGMRANPGQINRGQYRLHAGLDLAESPTSTTVVAAMAGVIAATPDTRGGGHQVVIDHGNALTTHYFHLSSRSVTTGQRVWAGAPLGIEGATGNVDGAHLHFEVRTNGAPTDPRTWLTERGVDVGAPDTPATAPPPALTDPGANPAAALAAPAGPAPLWPGGSPPPAAQLIAEFPARVGPWSGEQVVIAGQIIAAGQSRALDAKTITIAVMTGMAESSLTNVPHGDEVRGDTIGVFQNGPERGPYDVRMDPGGAAGIFYDYLARVPGYLELEPTIAAHKAQVNEDPYHYTPMWPEAVSMVAALTADPSLLQQLPVGGPVTGCTDGAPATAPPAAGEGEGSGAAIASAAAHYEGTDYSWGGGDTTGPTLGTYAAASLDGTHTVGFDCSGLVLFAVHHATGIALPHDSEAQGQDPRGAPVPRDYNALAPGDVISFSENGTGSPGSFGHVGIYAGEGKMIHAPRPGKPVQTVTLQGNAYWEDMAWSTRRYTTGT